MIDSKATLSFKGIGLYATYGDFVGSINLTIMS